MDLIDAITSYINPDNGFHYNKLEAIEILEELNIDWRKDVVESAKARDLEFSH